MPNNPSSTDREGTDQSLDPEEVVRFRCREQDASTVTPPRPAVDAVTSLREKNELSPTVAGSLHHDIKTRDALGLGWAVHPPESIRIQLTEQDGTLTATTDSDWVDLDTDPDAPSTMVTASVDTGWFIAVPEGVTALITPPLHDLSAPAVTQCVTTTGEFERLTIPVTVTETTTVNKHEPIAQIIPVQDTELVSDSAAGTITDEINTAIEQVTELHSISTDPYREHLRAERSTPELLSADSVRRSNRQS